MKTLKPEKGSPLEAAIALLIRNEAQFLETERETRREIAKIEREMFELKRESDDRFRRIERQFENQARALEAHGRLLTKHNVLIEGLTDAIRERIGFKSKR